MEASPSSLEHPKYNFNWYFYDSDEELEKLIETLNPKGIRERKLQENLRKLKEKSKFRKSRASKL